MFMERGRPVPAARRVRPAAIAMAFRCLTALLGGYAFASVIATLIARELPIERAEATSWGMIVSFLVYAGIALWSFHDYRLARVAAVVWGGALMGGVAIHLLGVRP